MPVSSTRRASAGKARRPAGTLNTRVYFFGGGKAEGRGDQKELLGGKGANLHDMTRLGLPVPPGFTITASTCAEFHKAGQKLPPGLMDEVRFNLDRLERITGKRFGDPARPLLVSVRSGAAVSMPGMMDTLLNLGLTDAVAEGLARLTGNERFACDSYRRLIYSLGTVVAGISHDEFDGELAEVKLAAGKRDEAELDADDLKQLVQRYKEIYRRNVGADWPQDAQAQLQQALEATFRSWNTPRALRYRQIHNIQALPGTAVNVQSMVFGNLGEDCGSGVAFTRDPATGHNQFYGEFLVNAQGGDVTAGVRAPLPISRMARGLPKAYRELLKIKGLLEKRYRDVQDFEFTVERGKVYLLQSRTGKRTARAAVRIAVEMVRERLIDQKTAILRIDPASLDQLLHPAFDPAAAMNVIATGLPASPGAAVGMIAFSAEEAEDRAAKGEKVILVRCETDPADIAGMHVAEGILTSTGGMTSHAAVVARGIGTPCVAGAVGLSIDQKKRTLAVGGRVFGPADWISIDGGKGEVYESRVPLIEPQLSGPFKVLMQWADRHRALAVRANADTPRDARLARHFGAQGVGLCRTEHMFFDPQRIRAMREMILAPDTAGRERALARLLPFQTQDFVGIFEVMNGLPVTIRLLDPPLHEFLPQQRTDQEALAQDMGLKLQQVQARVNQLREINPMLGHRGDRLAVTYPEILVMQVRAIIEAACSCKKRKIKVLPEIMVPLVATATELQYLNPIIHDTAARVMREQRAKIKYTVGTMIEVPRAALTSGEIAAQAEFFSFGTNDLTQMTLGFSRDDVNSFLPDYLGKRLLQRDPFQGIDEDGVGRLMRIAVEEGRSVRKDLKCGICGEHGGDPRSIAFCHRIGLDYVSCSPFRVPIARLAAAQAALRH